MLAGAVLIPDTALLVPGAAGRASVLDAERSAADDAVRRLLAARPDGVVVVVPGPAAAAPALGVPGHTGLGAAGVPDGALGDAVRVGDPRAHGVPAGRARGVASAGVAASVGLLRLAAAGWSGSTRVLTAAGSDAPALAAHGSALATAPGSLGLLLVGSLSARRGPDGPLPTDDRARAFEDAVLADLLDLGPDAARRLAAVPRGTATELAVSAWGPWQVLVGAAARTDGDAAAAPRGDLLHRSAPFGAGYAVLAWTGWGSRSGPGSGSRGATAVPRGAAVAEEPGEGP